ncbi:hypothetical protein SLA2020_265310 [Shorea laevis]
MLMIILLQEILSHSEKGIMGNLVSDECFQLGRGTEEIRAAAYALVAASNRLVRALANTQEKESSDKGKSGPLGECSNCEYYPSLSTSHEPRSAKKISTGSVPRLGPKHSLLKFKSRRACPSYGRKYPGKCKIGSIGCFHCGQHGHFLRECPMIKAQHDEDFHLVEY